LRKESFALITEAEMPKTIKINTPLEGNSPFILQIGEIYSTILDQDQDLTLTIVNPNKAKVSCTVETGAGEVSLYKNGERLLSLRETYTLSTEPGLPATVRLNTNITSPDNDTSRVIKVKKEELDKRKIARQYGVRENDIKVKSLKDTQKVTIPDSIWELYLVALGPGENKFKIQLV
jgi:hypothetical protein